MAAVVEGSAYFADGGVSTGCGIVAIVGGLAMVAGFLTPVAAAAIATGTVAAAFALLPSPTVHLLRNAETIAFVFVVSAAIVLLGPGAFSVDSYLFGRREIVIPHDPRSVRS